MGSEPVRGGRYHRHAAPSPTTSGATRPISRNACRKLASQAASTSPGARSTIATLFEIEPRCRVEVKHMDAIDMYFLNRIQPNLAADAEGCVPNDRFWNASGVG